MATELSEQQRHTMQWEQGPRNINSSPHKKPAGSSPASSPITKSPITKSPALLSKTSETARLQELARALKRGPAFLDGPNTLVFATGGTRKTQVGAIPAYECELSMPKDPTQIVYSARIADYRRWIPLVCAEQDNGRQRFRDRYTIEVIVPRDGEAIRDAKGMLHAPLEAEIQREWMRTAEAYQRQRKHIQLRNFAAKEPVSTAILLDSLRALPVKNVVLMLDRVCNCKSVNLAAMEAAEKIILEERCDEINAERARQQHQLEVAEGLVPAPKRQASEVGPFGETTDTHDIVYEVVKSGAGKGQTMPIRTWVPKSNLHSVGEEDDYEGPYFDSDRGIDWGN
jgi:hypothetical protein